MELAELRAHFTAGVWLLDTEYATPPKGVGAICDPTVFSGVVRVPPGVLGPQDGGVRVELIEPGHNSPEEFPWSHIVSRNVFCDVLPCVYITVGSIA